MLLLVLLVMWTKNVEHDRDGHKICFEYPNRKIEANKHGEKEGNEQSSLVKNAAGKYNVPNL